MSMSMKSIIKKVIVKSGLLRLRQYCLPKTILILYFHSVTDQWELAQEFIPGISVRSGTFYRLMQVLRKHYHPLTLEDIVEGLDGRKELPSRSVAITFDDGFEDNYRLAAPIMEEFGIRAAFYLTSGCVEHQTLPWFAKLRYLTNQAKVQSRLVHDTLVEKDWQLPHDARNLFLHHACQCACMSWQQQLDRIAYVEKMLELQFDDETAPRMMTWEMARDLIQRGHIIGNHTYSHPNVGHISREYQQIEIVESHRLLETRLGQTPKHFSYPHPCLEHQNDAVSDEMVRFLGYKTIVFTRHGEVELETSPFDLPRVSIGEMPLDELIWNLETTFSGMKS